MLDGRHLAFLLVMTTGCGALGCSSEPPTGDATGDVCAPGATQACLGPGRCEGAQICARDGANWEACECTGSPQPPDGGNGAVRDSGGAPPPDGAPISLIDGLDPDDRLAVVVSGWLQVPGAPAGTPRVVAQGDYSLLEPPAGAVVCTPSRFSVPAGNGSSDPGVVSNVALVFDTDAGIRTGTYSDKDVPDWYANVAAFRPDAMNWYAHDVTSDIPMFTLDIRTYDMATRRVALEMQVFGTVDFGTVEGSDAAVGRANLTIAVAGICP